MKRLMILLTLPLVAGITCLPSQAQSYLYSQARPGATSRTSQRTRNLTRVSSAYTSSQRVALPRTGFGNFTPVLGPRGRNNLPPTRLDSFVKQAGGFAERIYGDEGINGIPEYHEFTAEHRIERGIVGDRAAGLTTGHGSELPPAWGGDEFVDTEEPTQAGRQAQNHHFPGYTQVPIPPRQAVATRGDMTGAPLRSEPTTTNGGFAFDLSGI